MKPDQISEQSGITTLIFMNALVATNVCRDRFLLQTKNDINQGAGLLGKSDVSLGQANTTGMTPDQINEQRGITILFFMNALVATNACREIGWLFLLQTKNDIIHGEG